jgi:hypothetical protein
VELETWLKEALARVNENVQSPAFENVTADTNVFDAVDSFTIVDLLLETETLLEQKNGRYVALAGDTIFDATKTPLKRWSDWVKYVESRHAE